VSFYRTLILSPTQPRCVRLSSTTHSVSRVAAALTLIHLALLHVFLAADALAVLHLAAALLARAGLGGEIRLRRRGGMRRSTVRVQLCVRAHHVRAGHVGALCPRGSLDALGGADAP
jgi:hypothetical protein